MSGRETLAPSRGARSGRAGHERRERRGGRAREGVGTAWAPAGVIAALAFALLLCAAPAASNYAWAVDGFRSLDTGARFALIAFASGVAWLPFAGAAARRRLAPALGIAAALVIAFALRERVHFLGDTQIRQRAMSVFSVNMVRVSIVEWSTRMHANPLDILIDFLGPIGLLRMGASIADGVSVVSAFLALVFFAGVWRLSGRLGAPPEMRLALAAALALAGTLEVFAGYAESGGLLLATATWWWAEMLAPLTGRGQALRTALAWLVLFLAHRIGLVMLLPLAWRALGPPLAGDTADGRRWLIGAGLAGTAIAGVTLLLGAGGRQLGLDAGDLLPALPTMLRAVPPSDVLNLLLLVAPLAWLAPWPAGRARLAEFLRAPEARLVLIAALPLLPLVWIIPAGASALGAHRDWDLGTLAGFTLTLGAALLLARLPLPRLRGALVAALPVVVLLAGSWVMVNADPDAMTPRIRALAVDPPGLIAPQKSHLHVYLGQRAMDLGAPQFAAPEFDRAFELNPNPRRALMAAEAWARAGNVAAARASMTRARKAGPLPPSLEVSAKQVEALIDRLAATPAGGDSAARASTTPR
jgi:hypothetical protein